MSPRQSPDLPEALFPKLPPGRTSRSPEETAHNHRTRLMGAMRYAVAQHGYPGTTLHELVTLAGVSNTTFYQQFDSIPDCFLATFDQIVALVSERVGTAYRSQADFRDRLRAAFRAFVEIVVEEPAASALVVVDSLSLGSRRGGVARAIGESLRADVPPELCPGARARGSV